MNLKFKTIPLCVPLWEQREALAQGAKYSDELGFYIHSDELLDNFWGWLPRMYKAKPGQTVLLPEMLPINTWEQNVRGLMGTEVWDRMRKHAYQAAGFRCEICGDRGRLEAHENWRLINETCTQKLTRLLALCPVCHKAHHLGIARRLGMLPAVKAQLMRVNGWDARRLEYEIQEAYEVWEQRCDMPWTVDLAFLQDNGYVFV